MGIAESTVKRKVEKIKEANITIDYNYDENNKIYSYTIRIDQLIEPQMRPRSGKFGAIYDPLKGYKAQLIKKVLNEINTKEIKIPNLEDDNYTTAYIELVDTPPESWSISKQYQALINNVHFKTKPDIDNCVKTIYDSLEGIFFKNDSQVINETLVKFYGVHPMTLIHFNIYTENYEKERITKKNIDSIIEDEKIKQFILERMEKKK